MDGTEFDMRGFERSLPMVLLRAREASIRLFRPMFAEHDLTEQQWRVLRALAADRAPMDAGQLADTTFLLASSLSRILVSLEGESLITRQTSKVDRRRSMISLSPAGRRLVAEIAPWSEATYERLEERFGAERLEALIGELAALCEIVPSIDGPASRRCRTPQPATASGSTIERTTNQPTTSSTTDHEEDRHGRDRPGGQDHPRSLDVPIGTAGPQPRMPGSGH